MKLDLEAMRAKYHTRRPSPRHVLEDIVALIDELAETRRERDEADAHIAEAQEMLAELGVEWVGGDGSVTHGIGRLIEHRAAARAEVVFVKDLVLQQQARADSAEAALAKANALFNDRCREARVEVANARAAAIAEFRNIVNPNYKLNDDGDLGKKQRQRLNAALDQMGAPPLSVVCAALTKVTR